jgi:hypothetical protein
VGFKGDVGWYANPEPQTLAQRLESSAKPLNGLCKTFKWVWSFVWTLALTLEIETPAELPGGQKRGCCLVNCYIYHENLFFIIRNTPKYQSEVTR